MSVIQGPPGTGKTQTILNIIANLLIDNKSMQVVSNNNSATQNVFEKLSDSKYGMGFIVAALGNSENKKEFVRNQKGYYPDISHWALDAGKQGELKRNIDGNVRELSEIFSKQESIAMLRQKLSSLNLEIKYFEQYCSKSNFDLPSKRSNQTLNSEKLMQLWQKCEAFAEKQQSVSLWFKFKCVFILKIAKWHFFRNPMINIITLLQREFYEARRTELNSEIKSLENFLIIRNAKGKMESLKRDSLDYLHAKLFERYGNKPKRVVFTDDDLWKHPGSIITEYPIVLSTTFSSVSCLKGVTYDYLIMDEASQVDIATGALSLSTAQNAVIVGDLKQLPNIVKNEMKAESSALFDSSGLAHGYSFADNSFLKSVCSVVPNIPQMLLREHYRCHPKIIGFCNQKFYDNQLLIMKENKGEPDVLAVIKTTVGNHKRGHINQRQIDVILKEALPKLAGSDLSKIGIIAPYRDQVSELEKQLGTDKIEVDTVHKFQGREKDTIILTTVDDVVSDFSDDPYLLNVAVSRAINKLCLIVSGNKQPSDSNIGDLISYIEYNNYHIIESKINSVFDLLYKQYTEARIAYLHKYRKVSYYNSENLMYIALVKLLETRKNLSLSIICHQPLNLLINDAELLNDKQKYYVFNTLSHIDFLIYNKISKSPVLAIEVDGFKYHRHGTHQYELDRMKDEILKLYNIPMLRLPTNGSGEIERVNSALDGYEKNR